MRRPIQHAVVGTRRPYLAGETRSVQVLAICRPQPGAEPSELARRVPAETAGLQQLRADGHLLAAYSPGGPGAVLILEAPDVDAAASLVGDLPLASAGLIHAELIGLHPLL